MLAFGLRWTQLTRESPWPSARGKKSAPVAPKSFKGSVAPRVKWMMFIASARWRSLSRQEKDKFVRHVRGLLRGKSAPEESGLSNDLVTAMQRFDLPAQVQVIELVIRRLRGDHLSVHPVLRSDHFPLVSFSLTSPRKSPTSGHSGSRTQWTMQARCSKQTKNTARRGWRSRIEPKI